MKKHRTPGEVRLSHHNMTTKTGMRLALEEALLANPALAHLIENNRSGTLTLPTWTSR